jgi:hypothetical protein
VATVGERPLADGTQQVRSLADRALIAPRYASVRKKLELRLDRVARCLSGQQRKNGVRQHPDDFRLAIPD